MLQFHWPCHTNHITEHSKSETRHRWSKVKCLQTFLTLALIATSKFGRSIAGRRYAWAVLHRMPFQMLPCTLLNPTNTTAVTDCLSCGFTSYSIQNWLFRIRFSKLISWLGMVKKTKPNTTKACIHRSKNVLHQSLKNVLEHKINTKKLKPGLGTFYNIWPGNGAGLFWKENIRR